jgi:hypothetical protein
MQAGSAYRRPIVILAKRLSAIAYTIYCKPTGRFTNKNLVIYFPCKFLVVVNKFRTIVNN